MFASPSECHFPRLLLYRPRIDGAPLADVKRSWNLNRASGFNIPSKLLTAAFFERLELTAFSVVLIVVIARAFHIYTKVHSTRGRIHLLLKVCTIGTQEFLHIGGSRLLTKLLGKRRPLTNLNQMQRSLFPSRTQNLGKLDTCKCGLNRAKYSDFRRAMNEDTTVISNAGFLRAVQRRMNLSDTYSSRNPTSTRIYISAAVITVGSGAAGSQVRRTAASPLFLRKLGKNRRRRVPGRSCMGTKNAMQNVQ
ncbi:hypothetical protein K438DRAFT_1761734 [Mycena galopus ATCC 62051]|nr:hypothetical protein K438DRAFT_1761734 [Mycena galopus ATCC 62051]